MENERINLAVIRHPSLVTCFLDLGLVDEAIDLLDEGLEGDDE